MRNSQENHPRLPQETLHWAPRGAVPLVLVSGFLGAGKTTLMRRLIFEAAQLGLRPAVIVNEFGAADVDGPLLRGADAELLAALSGGCACCSGQDDLRETLLELAVRDAATRPGVILLEASGLADPLLLLDVVTAAELLPLVRAASLVAVADASRHLEFAAELKPILRRQVLLADVIVLNKIDIAGEMAPRTATALQALNPRARLLPATWAQCDLTPVWAAVGANAAGANAVSANALRAETSAAPHAHYHTVLCPMPHPVEKARLEAALGRLGPQVWRAKGFVRVRGLGGWQLLQYTGGGAESGPGGGRWHLAPFILPAYAAEPDGFLVFIGADLDRAQLMSEFAGTTLLAMI